MNSRPHTQRTHARLCSVLPGGVNSPVRSCQSVKQMPMIVERGNGDLIVDIDDHSYIDFCGSWGALIHGHAHPTILKAVYERMQKGTSFGISTKLEAEFAEEIIKLVPSMQTLRVVCSGTEATMTAIRLARGYTGRHLIIKFAGNYHGHADFLLVEAGSGVLENELQASSGGIPSDIIKHTICLPYNDIAACRHFFDKHGDDIAAVIVEPVAGNMGVVPGDKIFLNALRQLTTQVGALLIFDEVITGFRVALGGAQALYGIKPDLTCLGKIVGGGFPIAAFGGGRHIMQHLAPLGSVYQAGTLAGNPLGVEAGLQCLRLLQRVGFYENLEKKVTKFLQPLEEYIAKEQGNLCIQRVGSMFTIFFGIKAVRNLQDTLKVDREHFAKFFRFLFERGVYIPPSPYEAWFISDAHTEANLQKTQALIMQFLANEFHTC